MQPQLKKYSGTSNTASGFNFNWICYCTLKSDWYKYPKTQRYDKEYISEGGKKAASLGSLKKVE